MIKLIIFDRDDTLNIDDGFTYKLSDLRLMTGAKRVCEFVLDQGFSYAIATNQSGIGEGYYQEDDMRRFNRALFDKLDLDYSDDKVAFCPHPREMIARCGCRKPSPYLLLDLCVRFGVSPSEAVFIGDSETDAQAAERAGCHFIYVDPKIGHNSTIEKIDSLSGE